MPLCCHYAAVSRRRCRHRRRRHAFSFAACFLPLMPLHVTRRLFIAMLFSCLLRTRHAVLRQFSLMMP
jgi:hypothetical protein